MSDDITVTLPVGAVRALLHQSRAGWATPLQVNDQGVRLFEYEPPSCEDWRHGVAALELALSLAEWEATR